MTKSETIDRLIAILCAERGEKAPRLPEAQKPDYFRALCNVRAPKPATAEFLCLQDEYLRKKTQERGIIDVNGFTYRNGIALWRGDITRLNSDAIVNACNCALLGCFQPLHSCIDNVIHSFAGIQVRLDCDRMMQGGKEENGKVKVTSAYNLPSRYIFHTVGPIVYERVTAQNREDLKNCYLSCLNKAEEMGLRSIAFCCLSTGVYRFPKAEACKIAVTTVSEWLQKEKSGLNVIFNVFSEEDEKIYERELYGER